MNDNAAPSVMDLATNPAAVAARSLRLGYAATSDWAVPDTPTLDLPLCSTARDAEVRLLGVMRNWFGTDLRVLADLDERLGGALYRVVKATRADLKARGAEALPDANALVAGLSEALLDPDPFASLSPFAGVVPPRA